ncbi:MAG: DJ-1/PfpI family protein [Synoicihabitans sp.]
MATILTILPEGFEEIEAVTPIDLWRRAGFKVQTITLTSRKEVTGRSGITIQADLPWGAIKPEQSFDALFIPGGPGVNKLRESPDVRELVGQHFAAGSWIIAICAAPLVLKDAGLLDGRKFTAHPTVEAELRGILMDEPVVVDEKIVTSKGAGTSVDVGLKVIELLGGEKLAEDVALSICA